MFVCLPHIRARGQRNHLSGLRNRYSKTGDKSPAVSGELRFGLRISGYGQALCEGGTGGDIVLGL